MLVHTDHGAHIVAIITQATVADTELVVGSPVVALVQGSEIVLGVVDGDHGQRGLGPL